MSLMPDCARLRGFRIVLAIAAWRGYEYWVAKRAATAGAAYEAAASLIEQNKYAEADAAFAKVATDAPEGYRILARMRGAGALAQVKPAEAVKAYDEISNDTSVAAVWRDLAAVRQRQTLLIGQSFGLRELAEPSCGLPQK